MIELAGARVHLRPLRYEEFDRLRSAREQADATVSPRSSGDDELCERIVHFGTLTGWGLALGIEASGSADCAMYRMTRNDYEGVKDHWTRTS